MASEGGFDHAEQPGTYEEDEGAEDAGQGDDDESVLSFGDEDEEADGQLQLKKYHAATESRPASAGPGDSAQPAPAAQPLSVKPAAKQKIEFPAGFERADATPELGGSMGSMSVDGMGRRRHSRSRGQGGMGLGNPGPPVPPPMLPNFGPMNGLGHMIGGMAPGMSMIGPGLGPSIPPPHPPLGPSLAPLSALGGPLHRPTPPPVPPPGLRPSWVPPPHPPASRPHQSPLLLPGSLPQGAGGTFRMPPNPALMLHALGGGLNVVGSRAPQASGLAKKSVMLSMLEGAGEAPHGQQSAQHLRPVVASIAPALAGAPVGPRPVVAVRPAARASMAALLSKGSHAGYDVLKPQAPAAPQASVWVRPELVAATQPQDDAANKPAIRKPTLAPSLPVLGETATQPKATTWINPDIGKNHVSLAHGLSIPSVATAPPGKPAGAPSATEVNAEELERKRLELEQKEADLKKKEEEQIQLIHQMQLQMLQQTLVQKFTQEAIEPAHKSRGRKRSRSRSRSRSRTPDYRDRRRRSRSDDLPREEEYRHDEGAGYDGREVEDEPFTKQWSHHEDRNGVDEVWHDSRGGGEHRSSESRKRPGSQAGYRDRANNHWDDADPPHLRDYGRGDDRRAPPRHASHNGERERSEPRRDTRGEDPRREGRFEPRREGRSDGYFPQSEFGRDRVPPRDAPRERDRPMPRRDYAGRDQGFSNDGPQNLQRDARRTHADYTSEPPLPPPPLARQRNQRRDDQKQVQHDVAAHESDRARSNARQPRDDRQRAMEPSRDQFRQHDGDAAKRSVRIEFPEQDRVDFKPDVLRMREQRFNLANKQQEGPAEPPEQGRNGGHRGGRRSGRRGPGNKGRR